MRQRLQADGEGGNTCHVVIPTSDIRGVCRKEKYIATEYKPISMRNHGSASLSSPDHFMKGFRLTIRTMFGFVIAVHAKQATILLLWEIPSQENINCITACSIRSQTTVTISADELHQVPKAESNAHASNSVARMAELLPQRRRQALP